MERTAWFPVDTNQSRQMGDEWIRHEKVPILEVPSVLVPRQKNYLINPLHRLSPAIKIIDESPFALDSRLLSSI